MGHCAHVCGYWKEVSEHGEHDVEDGGKHLVNVGQTDEWEKEEEEKRKEEDKGKHHWSPSEIKCGVISARSRCKQLLQSAEGHLTSSQLLIG